MRTTIQRGVVPLILLVAGIGSFVHGMLFHVETVIVERVETFEVEDFGFPAEMDGALPAEPPPFDMDPGGDPFGGASPFDLAPFDEPAPFEEATPFPPLAGRMKMVTITETFLDEIQVWEPDLVYDVTFGGVVMDESGRPRRTYSGDSPPEDLAALCPT